MQIPLTEPQERFAMSRASKPAIIGGLGSGKTQAGTTRANVMLLREPGISVGYYMPTYDLITLRAMPGIEEQLDTFKIRHKVNKSKYKISAIGYGEIIFRSYDTPGRIIAYEVGHSIVDELDTLPKEKAALVWRKINERNRQKTNFASGNTIGNVTTPDQGYSGFTYARWVERPFKNSEIIKAPTYSNPYLPADYIASIRETYDPLLAEMYIEGEFVSLSHNKVYHFFDRKKHHSPRTLTDSDLHVHIALDFNVGGTCASVWVVENNKPIAVDEFVSVHTQDFTVRAAKYRATSRGEKRTVTVYPDASGDNASSNASQTDIQIIRNAGFSIDAPLANPDIRDSVNACNALFGHDRIAINTDKCQRLTNAVESQGYDKKGAPEKFSEHPAIDDWTDGMRYFINRKFPIIRPMATLRMAGI